MCSELVTDRVCKACTKMGSRTYIEEWRLGLKWGSILGRCGNEILCSGSSFSGTLKAHLIPQELPVIEAPGSKKNSFTRNLKLNLRKSSSSGTDLLHKEDAFWLLLALWRKTRNYRSCWNMVKKNHLKVVIPSTGSGVCTKKKMIFSTPMMSFGFLDVTFEGNVISKNNFQWSDGSEYVSNMFHMLKTIIIHGSYGHLKDFTGL